MDGKNKNNDSSLRLKLIKVASEIILNEGLKKLTMRALSQHIGVSRTAPYRHFENKNALLMTIAEEGFNELRYKYKKINNDTSLDSLSRLQNIGITYIEFAIRNPDIFKLMFGKELARKNRSVEFNTAAGKVFKEYLIAVEIFSNEYKEKMKSNDILIFANYSWATVHGLATLLIDDQIQLSGEDSGFPILFTDQKVKQKNSIQSMISFSKRTLMEFWDMVLNEIKA
ncbi:MAG: TetR/AcrR family transcriptional regulator [Deltaproteobacteria bacterium]|nr:TetR/AcrR family transcriptional regulator [Deltaproteobacteria bacterium]